MGINRDLFNSNLKAYVPPPEAGVEYVTHAGVVPPGSGCFAGFSRYEREHGWWDGVNHKHNCSGSNLYFGALANYQINVHKKLDLYAGPRLGAGIYRDKHEHCRNAPDGAWAGFHFGFVAGGATWYFGANAEMGYPTLFRLAVSFKF